MSESQFHAVTKAELKRQEKLLKILREQGARRKVSPLQVAPAVMPAQTITPEEGVQLQHVAGKVLRGTGEFNVPRLPDGRPIDKFFQDARQRMSLRRKDLKDAAAGERIEEQAAREKATKEQKEIKEKRDKLKEGTPDQKRRQEKERDRVEREHKWANERRCEENCRRTRDQKRKDGEGFTAF